MMTDRTERRRRLTHAGCTPSANNQRTTRLPPHPGFSLGRTRLATTGCSFTGRRSAAGLIPSDGVAPTRVSSLAGTTRRLSALRGDTADRGNG